MASSTQLCEPETNASKPQTGDAGNRKGKHDGHRQDDERNEDHSRRQ